MTALEKIMFCSIFIIAMLNAFLCLSGEADRFEKWLMVSGAYCLLGISVLMCSIVWNL